MRVIKVHLWKLESLTIKTVVVILLQSMHHQEVYIGWRIQLHRHKEKSVDGKIPSSYKKREKHSTNSNWTIISLSLWFTTSSVMFSSDFDHVTNWLLTWFVLTLQSSEKSIKCPAVAWLSPEPSALIITPEQTEDTSGLRHRWPDCDHWRMDGVRGRRGKLWPRVFINNHLCW